MTYEEIIQAENCCCSISYGCPNCPLLGQKDCTSNLKKEEIKMLNEYHQKNKQLNEILKGREQLINTLNKCYKKAKIDAYEEFAGMFKKTVLKELIKDRTEFIVAEYELNKFTKMIIEKERI